MSTKKPSLEGFVPPANKRPKAPEWATYIPDRSTATKFKIHNGRGMALNAISTISRDAILYHLIDGEWVEVYRTGSDDFSTCSKCGGKLGKYEDIKWVINWNGPVPNFPQIHRVAVHRWGKCPENPHV